MVSVRMKVCTHEASVRLRVQVAGAIQCRGMHLMLAARIQVSACSSQH